MNQSKEKIRIRLESFNHQLLNFSCQKLVTILGTTSVDSINLVSLPTKKRIYCVLRSPHVNKDSREHFEIRSHKRILDVWYHPDLPLLDILSQADLPSGVFYSLCLS